MSLSKARTIVLGTLVAAVVLFACVSIGVRSTGAVLPQASDVLMDENIRVEVKHHCSGGRCKSFSARIRNNSDEVIEIVPSQSRIRRAGEEFPIRLAGEARPNPRILPGKSATVEFQAIHPTTLQRMSYVKAREVWCSLKVDSGCQNPSDGESKCSAFARAYHQNFTSTGGWISVSLAYRTPSQTQSRAIATEAPQFLGEAPSVRLSPTSKAPFWASSSGEVVFHKVSCDKACRCDESSGRRNFFTDDKFLPM